ncbi:MAG TPA: hypothetical protein VMH86_05480 [Rhizomicrobium sp.]|nr:hypothetical protein [Rhizomicrobium sp.]
MGMKDNKTVEMKPGSTASVEIPKDKASDTKLDITVKVAKDEDKKPPKPLRGLQAFRNA